LLKTCAKLAEESNSYQNLIENRQSFKDYWFSYFIYCIFLNF
jgi:hypothetical protein